MHSNSILTTVGDRFSANCKRPIHESAFGVQSTLGGEK